MKNLNLAILLLSFAPTTSFAGNETDYRVKGDDQAVAICKAVLSDDAKSLNTKLERYHKQDRVMSKYIRKHDPVMLDDFSCNGKTLLQFAEAVSSTTVVRYLDSYNYGSPTVYVEDVAIN